MIEAIKAFLIDTAQFSSMMGFFLYWVPLALCAGGYTFRTFKNFQTDRTKRAVYEKLPEPKPIMYCKGHYLPTDTFADLVIRFFAIILPVINLWASIFDVFPSFAKRVFKCIVDIFEFLDDVLSKPLVPERTKK